ncbi:MAG: FAD-binding oxidoreductase [Woeseia sp.]
MKTAAYPSYLRKCGWHGLLPARAHQPSLQTDTRCDVAIVGAGYTGIAAAKRWAELSPGSDIVLVDASVPEEGNPGRNSGFLLEVALAHDANPGEMQRMKQCNGLLSETMQQIVADVAASGIDCGLRRTGTYRAAAGAEGIRALEQYRQFLDAAGLPATALDRDQLEDRLGTRFYRQGLYSPHCYLAQPAALVRAMLNQLRSTVRRFEHTPATSLQRTDSHWELATPGGRITSRHVVLANNAFAKGLGIGGSRIVAMYTYAALTAPLAPAALDKLGSEQEWGLLPAHRLGSTLRRTADGRLLVRSLYGYERESGDSDVESALQSSLHRRFPLLGDLEFESLWSGATGFTMNGAPVWGEHRPGLFVSAGCNGGGVVKGTLFGRLLADLAHGKDVPDVHALFGRARWMPPEPFRSLGFKLMSRLERRRAAAEV